MRTKYAVPATLAMTRNGSQTLPVLRGLCLESAVVSKGPESVSASTQLVAAARIAQGRSDGWVFPAIQYGATIPMAVAVVPNSHEVIRAGREAEVGVVLRGSYL